MSKVKKLKLEIDFVNISCLDDVFSEIKQNLMAGEKSFKQTIGDTKFKGKLEHVISKNYREEQINGVWCLVFQSKMNFNYYKL